MSIQHCMITEKKIVKSAKYIIQLISNGIKQIIDVTTSVNATVL